MEEDLYTWGESQQLSEEIVDTLLAQDITCVTELLSRDLSDQEVDNLDAAGLLTWGQCQRLKTAVRNLRLQLYPESSHGGSDVMARGPTSRLPGDTTDDDVTTLKRHQVDDNDEDDEDEQLQMVLEMSASAIREEPAREYSGPYQTRAASSPVTSPSSWEEDVDEETLSIGPENTIRLLLLGKTGNGKSTTGNTILGQNKFSAATTFGSVTSECERHVGTRGDKKIEIMDSPGLYDTHKSHEEICTLIVQAVAGMHPGPHAVLYVIRVGRYTEEEFSAFQRLKALFDDSIARHVILLFTHGDQLQREGKTLENLLQAPGTPENLRTVLAACGHRYILFDNTAADPEPQVQRLLEQVKSLVEENGGRSYSCPRYGQIGQGMEEEVARRLEGYERRDLQRRRYVRELEHKTQQAERTAARAREEYERREEARERERWREEERMRQAERELEEQLSAQQAVLQQQEEELQELRRQQQDLQDQRERELLARQEDLSREDRQRQQQEAEDLARREREMTQRLREQQLRVERQRAEERRRLDAEMLRLQREQEEQRRRDMEEIDRRNREREDQRERQRIAEKEEADRRERERRREMERLKDKIVKKEEPGFLEKAVRLITSPIRAIFRLFS